MMRTLKLLCSLVVALVLATSACAQQKNLAVDSLLQQYFEFGQFNGSILVAEPPRKSVGETIYQTIAKRDIAAGIAEYRKLKATDSPIYDFSEDELNNVGYLLLRSKRTKEAIEIFKLNVEMFPKLSNPYDSLGEAYLADDQKELALTNYKKAVELDATNITAIEAVRRLEVKEVVAVDDQNERTKQFVQKVMAEKRIPGLQIAIIKNNQIELCESYGLANVENQIPVTNKTLFSINSATKAFTGVALMQMVESGMIDLNGSIDRYLDDLPDSWRKIRVRQLLAHTSGLPNIVDRQGLIGAGTELDAWREVKKLPLDSLAGESFAYNQTNYGLLARIITSQTKVPFEQFFAERQFSVAVMASTRFGDSYDLVPGSATNYSFAKRRILVEEDDNRLAHWVDELPPGLRTGGGIQTTADDLARWLVALSKGRLLSESHVRQMWTPEKLNNGVKGGWGAGWVIRESSPDREVAGIGGGRSAFVVFPERALAIIVLTNLVGANPENFIPQIAQIYE